MSRSIVNATTPGYTRKIRPQEAEVVAGHNMGVDLGRMTRTVDAGVRQRCARRPRRSPIMRRSTPFRPNWRTTWESPDESTSLSHGQLNALNNTFRSLAANSDVPVNRYSSYP
ncbi:MAG: hypothetical protein M5R42_07405 [Rhodocyclaceae bacterium]|nr:hypothetical protein [Rhodocyclaceae bacterium]